MRIPKTKKNKNKKSALVTREFKENPGIWRKPCRIRWTARKVSIISVEEKAKSKKNILQKRRNLEPYKKKSLYKIKPHFTNLKEDKDNPDGLRATYNPCNLNNYEGRKGA